MNPKVRLGLEQTPDGKPAVSPSDGMRWGKLVPVLLSKYNISSLGIGQFWDDLMVRPPRSCAALARQEFAGKYGIVCTREALPETSEVFS